MKQKQKKYYTTISLVWIGCAIVLFFAYMAILEPQRRQRESVADQLDKQKKAFQDAEKANEKETQERLAAELEALKLKLKGYVVDFADSANLTFDISEIASNQKIDAFSIKSQDSRSSTKMTDFDCIDENYFDVSLTADFNKFAVFLNALERHDPTLLVDGFSITRSEDLSAGHQARLNLAVLVKKK